jgi:hypothetical protein
MRDLQLAFTTATTSNASQVIPPGYRPLLATSAADRPLYAAPTRGELSDATPFAIPGTVAEASVASGAATHVEGANPTDGTLTFETKTIVPQGISGLFRVTRELVDSSNPAVDQIAMMAMREDYDRAAEQRVHTELNTVQSGTITNGLVPSGAQARTSTGMALPADLRKALLTFVDVRKRRARVTTWASTSYVAMVSRSAGCSIGSAHHSLPSEISTGRAFRRRIVQLDMPRRECRFSRPANVIGGSLRACLDPSSTQTVRFRSAGTTLLPTQATRRQRRSRSG